MQDTLWNLLGIELDNGRILTERTDAARKLQWLNAFATKHLKGTELSDLKDVLDRINEARLDRNFIMHGTWSTHVIKCEPIAFSVREKSDDPTQVIGETFPEWRMRKLILTIAVCKIALMRWSNQHAKARGKPVPNPKLEEP